MKSVMSIEILPAQLADIPNVARLEKELNATHSWSQKTFENLLGDETCWIWVAKKENEIVGYLVCQVVADEAELHDIAVTKEFRRQGIGRLLLERLESELKEKGIKKIFLLVRCSNLAAQTFYSVAGLRKIGIRSSYYRDPEEDALLFCKELI